MGSTSRTFIRNFDYSEFDCYTTPGSGYKHMDREFLLMIDEARQIAGITFKILRGYVTPAHSDRINLPKDHPHLLGRAACIWCKDSSKRLKIVSSLLEVGFVRIGISPEHIYIDNDETRPPMISLFSRDTKIMKFVNDDFKSKYRSGKHNKSK